MNLRLKPTNVVDKSNLNSSSGFVHLTLTTMECILVWFYL